MTTTTAIPGLGFDVNQPLSKVQAVAFKDAGYSFCIRYVPRTSALAAGNISASEAQEILSAGLGLMIVQHCPLPGWEPSGELGNNYGEYAATCAKAAGMPPRTTIWLDLEEVASGTPSSDTINYCNNWFEEVQSSGYVPGLYVGYNCGLSSDQLYKDLKFKSYWKAYNYDDGVSVRGFQLIQETQKTLNGITFDPNRCEADNLGGLPIWATQ